MRITSHTPSALDVDGLRAQTPAADAGVHLNNASAALMPGAVGDAMHAFLRDEVALGPHAAAERHGPLIDGVRTGVARLLGSRQPIEFFDTVSRAFALLLDAVPWQAGDRIVLARHEWGSVHAAAAQLAQRTGVGVETVDCGDDTAVDLAALARRLDDRVRVVTLPLHTAVGGRPSLALDLPRPPGCLVFGDGAQAFGQMPFDLEQSGYDVVVGTARKWLRGPRGIAFAGFSADGYRLLERAAWLASGAGGPAVTSDYTRVLRVGLGAAVDHALALGIDAVKARVLALAGRLHAGLTRIPGVAPLDAGGPASGIVAFRCGGREEALVRALAAAGIRVALIEARYHPGLFRRLGIARVVRISPHVYNTGAEIDRTLDVAASVLAAREAGHAR